jgi:hypothetical protein
VSLSKANDLSREWAAVIRSTQQEGGGWGVGVVKLS